MILFVTVLKKQWDIAREAREIFPPILDIPGLKAVLDHVFFAQLINVSACYFFEI